MQQLNNAVYRRGCALSLIVKVVGIARAERNVAPCFINVGADERCCFFGKAMIDSEHPRIFIDDLTAFSNERVRIGVIGSLPMWKTIYDLGEGGRGGDNLGAKCIVRH